MCCQVGKVRASGLGLSLTHTFLNNVSMKTVVNVNTITLVNMDNSIKHENHNDIICYVFVSKRLIN